jgi:hypothetical protein
MSEYSPGTVGDDEQIAFFVFDPQQIKNGKVKPTAFSYVYGRGRSVQRETIATDDELAAFVNTFLSGAGRKWDGVLVARAARLRKMRLHGIDGQVVCLYDTAERTNPSHAEICSGVTMEDNGDANELRHLLWSAFDADHPITRTKYRGGTVHSRVP